MIAVVDAGRLSAAPLPAAGGERPTVLDACLDALTALALVADEAGDRFGAIAFDDEVRFAARPGRARGAAVVRSLFDLQARPVDVGLRGRLPPRRGRQARVRARALRPARGVRRAPARRGRPGARPPPRRRRREPADPGPDALAARRPDPPASSPAPPSRSRSAPPGHEPPRSCGGRALRCSRRGPAALPSACVAAYLRAKARRAGTAGAARVGGGLPGCRQRRSVPRAATAAGGGGRRGLSAVQARRRPHDVLRGPIYMQPRSPLQASIAGCGPPPRHEPQNTTAPPSPSSSCTPQRQLRPRGEALEHPAQHEPRRRSESQLDGVPCLGHGPPARADRAPGRDAHPRRRPAMPPTTMQESSSGPWEETSRRNAAPLPAAKASPPTTPRISPLKSERERGAGAGGCRPRTPSASPGCC